MAHVAKSYTFTSPAGTFRLADLFEGRRQLIVYHFMLAPDQETGCPGCSFLADNLPRSLEHLNSRDTTLVLISRASSEKIEKFKKRMGWNFPWYSSLDSDFNFDFNVSFDKEKGPTMYNVSPAPINASTCGLWNMDTSDTLHKNG
jgi:predicted dithiol-disulfide oxidoreductase (DUF899 family)